MNTELEKYKDKIFEDIKHINNMEVNIGKQEN